MTRRRVRRRSVSLGFSVPPTRSHDYDKESTTAPSASCGRIETEGGDLVVDFEGREVNCGLGALDGVPGCGIRRNTQPYTNSSRRLHGTRSKTPSVDQRGHAHRHDEPRGIGFSDATECGGLRADCGYSYAVKLPTVLLGLVVVLYPNGSATCVPRTGRIYPQSTPKRKSPDARHADFWPLCRDPL